MSFYSFPNDLNSFKVISYLLVLKSNSLANLYENKSTKHTIAISQLALNNKLHSIDKSCIVFLPT